MIQFFKQSFKSRSIWFNILYILVVIASLFGFQEFQPDSWVTETIQNPIVVSSIQAIGNWFFRWITTKPLTDK